MVPVIRQLKKKGMLSPEEPTKKVSMACRVPQRPDVRDFTVDAKKRRCVGSDRLGVGTVFQALPGREVRVSAEESIAALREFFDIHKEETAAFHPIYSKPDGRHKVPGDVFRLVSPGRVAPGRVSAGGFETCMDERFEQWLGARRRLARPSPPGKSSNRRK